MIYEQRPGRCRQLQTCPSQVAHGCQRERAVMVEGAAVVQWKDEWKDVAWIQ